MYKACPHAGLGMMRRAPRWLANLAFSCTALLGGTSLAAPGDLDNAFGVALRRPGVVQLVSILSDAACVGVAFPIALPKGEEWIVRIVGYKNRFRVWGVPTPHEDDRLSRPR